LFCKDTNYFETKCAYPEKFLMLGGLKRHIKGVVLLNNAFVLSNNAFDLTNIGAVLTLPQAFLPFRTA